MKNTMYVIALAILATGCYKKPKACFKMDKTEAQIGEEITFNDCSENTTRRILKTGDLASGIPIVEDFETGVAKHVYHQAGTYTIELESLFCKNEKCKSDKTTQVIKIN